MQHRILLLTLAALLTATLLTATQYAGELSLRQTDTGYEVRISDDLFAGYITNFAGTPILYPIVGPNGKHMTRDFPMVPEYEGMNSSHPHQRSFWFTHGNVNGHDFWAAFDSQIRIVHQRFAQAKSDGQTALLITENHWIAYDEVLASDVRMLRFSASENARIVDVDVTVTAEKDNVVFGDTREGNLGIRVPEVIAAATGKGGRFVNAEGGVNERGAWSRRSAWINYYGEMDGERVGIAILNHPSSFRFPAYWHTREYGLFAANVFGVGEFERLEDRHAGALTLSQGESFTLRFRVVFYRGDMDIDEAFRAYAEEDTPAI